MAKVKSWKQDTVPESRMILRVATVRAETANDDAKSIEVVIASENPVERYDEERGEVVSEILSMDGVTFRNDKNKLPIVDSHDRSTVRNVLGTVRNVRIDGTQLVGDAVFASDEESQNAYQKLREGHLDDFSITATPNEIENIRRGETGIFREQEITGPAAIVTNWTPTDASLVAVGADETSTVRSALLRSYYDLKREEEKMTDEQRAALVGRGMDENATLEEALEFAIQNMAPDEPVENMDEETLEEIVSMGEEEKIENAEEETEEVVKSAVDRALKADHKRQKEIRAICRQAKQPRAFADELCKPGVSLERAREKVLERMIENSKPLGSTDRIEVVSEGSTRTRAAMRDGLIRRAARQTNKTVERGHDAPGYEDFERMSLRRMSEEWCALQGANVRRMSNKDIALVAMGHRPTVERMRHGGIIREDAWHSTGSFTNLLLDAMNKTLLDGYEEAPVTWDMWARQGPATADLKEIHRMRFSEFPDLADVPEGDNYAEGKTSDAKESYKPQKKGRVFSITWETIVNDDLDAISRIPQMQGAAARRTQNKAVYSVLTDNAAMADGVALFNAAHSNLAGSGAVISETTLNAAYTAMMTQTNLGGEIIGVEPKFLIVPAAISATALQTVVSITPPTVGGTAAGTSNTINLYGPNGMRQLTPIVVPQLDGNSTTAWYLASDHLQVDTVELTFLEGEEAPVLESWWSEINDVYLYKVRQTFGVKAIDWRGLYKNPGA
jgi:hypothetical protein